MKTSKFFAFSEKISQISFHFWKSDKICELFKNPKTVFEKKKKTKKLKYLPKKEIRKWNYVLNLFRKWKEERMTSSWRMISHRNTQVLKILQLPKKGKNVSHNFLFWRIKKFLLTVTKWIAVARGCAFRWRVMTSSPWLNSSAAAHSKLTEIAKPPTSWPTTKTEKKK